MAETRRMHYVPRTYLSRFGELRKGQAYVHALDKQTRKIFSPNVNNICLEADIYRLQGATEAERQQLERMYCEFFEKNYDALYAILTDDTREVITMEERYDIIAFGVSLLFRNNVWNTAFNKIIDESYARAYQLAKDTGGEKFFFGNQEISIAGKSLEDLQLEARKQDGPMLALTAMGKIFKSIRLRVVSDVVTVITTPVELVTSDNPVIFSGAADNRFVGPMDPRNTLTIPIDGRHLLQLRPWADELDRTMLGRMSDNSIMSHLSAQVHNQEQYGQPGRFLIGSEAAITNFKYDPNGENIEDWLRAKLK